MQSSRHLDDIIERRESAANTMFVFADIVSYSQRRTIAQKRVVDRFTDLLARSLHDTAAGHLPYIQRNGLDFSNDVIRIPTGDGAAVGFAFEGLHEVHIKFTHELLRRVRGSNVTDSCELYSRNGWCNCHSNFDLRVGISEGKTVIYRDINGNYNAAGNALNMAARVMSLMDPGQVALTPDAYERFIDMAESPREADNFNKYSAVRIKHGVICDIYQYAPHGSDYIESSRPTRIDPNLS